MVERGITTNRPTSPDFRVVLLSFRTKISLKSCRRLWSYQNSYIFVKYYCQRLIQGLHALYNFLKDIQLHHSIFILDGHMYDVSPPVKIDPYFNVITKLRENA